VSAQRRAARAANLTAPAARRTIGGVPIHWRDRRPEPDYDKLAAHLAARSEPRLMLTFAELEAIVGEPLPLSARHVSQWWHSTDHRRSRHGFAWRTAGWQLEHVDVYAETVTFVRVESTAPDAHSGS
jgi:hypothetical protein